MKKFICLFLISALCACSMFGCKNKNQNDSSTEAGTELNTENFTDSTKDSMTQEDNESTDSTATEPESSEQGSDDETLDAKDKQALWEDVFSNSKYTLDSYSFVIDAGELMKMSMFTDEDSKAYFEASGSDENGNNMAFGFLFNNDDVYFHRSGVDGEQKIDQWLKCTGMNTGSSEVKEDLDVNDLSNMDAFTSALGAISKIEYIESVGDIDRLAIHYIPLDESDDEWTTTYDVTIEVEYNGQKGEYRYTEQSTSTGLTSNSYISQSPIDGFSWKEWDFDKDSLTLTKGDQTVQCKLVQDHLSESTNNAIIEVEINAKTYAIQKMIMTEDDVEMVVEFVESPDLDELFTIPSDVESIKYEDAMTEFVMGMLAFALSGIQ